MYGNEIDKFYCLACEEHIRDDQREYLCMECKDILLEKEVSEEPVDYESLLRLLWIYEGVEEVKSQMRSATFGRIFDSELATFNDICSTIENKLMLAAVSELGGHEGHSNLILKNCRHLNWLYSRIDVKEFIIEEINDCIWVGSVDETVGEKTIPLDDAMLDVKNEFILLSENMSNIPSAFNDNKKLLWSEEYNEVLKEIDNLLVDLERRELQSLF